MTFDPEDTRCNWWNCNTPAVFRFTGVWPDTDSHAGGSADLTDMAGRHVRACQGDAPEVMRRLAGYPEAPPVIRAEPFAQDEEESNHDG